ncbi:Dolichyl-diphosphooligosaccharide--protein glycosyltransferase subunit STT3B [Oryzias melastigma]|uniref:dolichyl-diphosphooligosaccharide--protein glycotransferase n=1 Tax=Oryzias melastigma TaxID=30732 RepID=A0A834C028_ORYME|nr:Dolichyl-diphosphooligosaccharide--protein glycosyltransferase subunit STT3B [Oryzias melastigma]
MIGSCWIIRRRRQAGAVEMKGEIRNAYSTFYIIGLILSMQIPFVGFQPIRTSEHMAAAGVFVLLQVYAFLQYLKDRLTRQKFQTLFFLGVSLAAGVFFLAVIYLTCTGYIAPWSGRFYSLWDTGYAKIHIPIIASVSEHQPTTWVSFFCDLHILVCTFPAGLWFCIKSIYDERVFVALYAISAVYFAGVMVRLMLTLTPVVCVLSAVAFSRVFEHYLGDDAKKQSPPAEETGRTQGTFMIKCVLVLLSVSLTSLPTQAGKVRKHVSEQEKAEDGLGPNMKSIVTMLMLMLLMISRNILDDFREAYYWLWQNANEHATVMSWWDYGYQIAGMANRTTLVDNNTWNNSHIALESDYFILQGEFRVDKAGSPTLINCLMYKMSYYRFGEMQLDFRTPPGFDRTRNAKIGNKDIKLKYLEEAFTSEHWLVRIYKVKKLENRDRMENNLGSTDSSHQKFTSKKTAKRKRGFVKNKLVLKKGKKVTKKSLY